MPEPTILTFDDEGCIQGECWNCAATDFILVEFVTWVEVMCSRCGEPQTVVKS